MNSLRKMQQRFLETGEVELRRGVRFVLNLIFVSSFGAAIIAFGIGIGYVAWQAGINNAGDVSELVFAGFIVICGLLAFIAYPLAPFVPVTRKMGRMRITRAGISIAGVAAPWHVIADVELTDVAGSRGTTKVVDIKFVPQRVSPQAVRSDGSKSGQQQADYSNDRRVLSLWNAELNVRPKTLVAFLKWARTECAGPFLHERRDFNFEQL